MNNNNSQKIYVDKHNWFISVLGKDNVLNHHPLEIPNQHHKRSRLIIRETVRIIDNSSFFKNSRITFVVIPSSVEVFDDYSINECTNLRFIRFKNNSRFRAIDNIAFSESSIEQIIIPKTVKRIWNNAFNRCKKLRSFVIHKDSVLNEIGCNAFYYSAIGSIFIPLGLTKIRVDTFYRCPQLRSVSFHEDSKLVIIEQNAFTMQESNPWSFQHLFMKFNNCNNLVTVRFLGNSSLKKLILIYSVRQQLNPLNFPHQSKWFIIIHLQTVIIWKLYCFILI